MDFRVVDSFSPLYFSFPTSQKRIYWLTFGPLSEKNDHEKKNENGYVILLNLVDQYKIENKNGKGYMKFSLENYLGSDNILPKEIILDK